jgi:hypothetical protein
LLWGGGIGKDRIDDVVRSPIVFNSYVRPWTDTDMWEQRCIDVHQITYDDERIQSAEGIKRVRQQFTSWFYREVNTSKTVVLVAWNGETCDLKWLWKITQAPGSRCSLPQQIKFFIDPFWVVGYFKTCPINKTKSKIESCGILDWDVLIVGCVTANC